MGYTYLVEDIVTRRIVDEIPFISVDWSDYLMRPGRFQGSIGVRHPKATVDNLDEGRRAVYVVRDGQVLWGGILWEASVQPGTDQVTVTAEGWLGYLDHRLTWVSHDFATGTDQLAVAAWLVEAMQTFPGADLALAVRYDTPTGGPTSGVVSDVAYRQEEPKVIGQELRDLAALPGGFDFAVEYALTDTGVAKTLVLSWPRRGTRGGLVFELDAAGGNIVDRGVTRSAYTMATRMIGLGAGEGAAKILAGADSPELVGVYPLLDATAPHVEMVTFDPLAAATQGDLARAKRPRRLPTVIIDPAADPVFGTYLVGDDARVTLADGFATLDGWYRIVGWEVTVGDDGTDRPALIVEEAS